MRPLHLLGLPGRDGGRLRFRPSEELPLVLPSFIAREDQEQILAFYQQALAEAPLPRVEIDWDFGLLQSSRDYLEYARRRFGSEGLLLVVKVRSPHVDLRDVETEPTVSAFRYLAIADGEEASSEQLRVLAELAKCVEQRAEELYEELADHLGLRRDGWTMVEPLVQTFLSPIEVLETVNALIEVQLEPLSQEQHQEKVYSRMVTRQLERRPAEELIALLGVAVRDRVAVEELLGSKEAERQLHGLRYQLLWRDGAVRRWAQFIRVPAVQEAVRETGPTRAQRTEGMAERVRTALGWLDQRADAVASFPKAGDGFWEDQLVAAVRSVREGRLGRALETLAELARKEPPSLSGRVTYHLVRGLALRECNALESAEVDLRVAQRLQDEAGAPGVDRATTWDHLGKVLQRLGRGSQALEAFRRALQLKEEGGDALVSRGRTQHELARVLEEEGLRSEAEQVFLEALRLKEEGQDTSTSQGVTLHELGRLLAQGSQPAEKSAGVYEESPVREGGREIAWRHGAEETLRAALRLKEEGGDTATSRGDTLHELGSFLRTNGRSDDAEKVLRDALQLKEAGGDTPTSRGRTLHELGKLLLNRRRLPEADQVLRKALRLMEEGGSRPNSRAAVLFSLAFGLDEQRRWEEAREAVQQASRLNEEDAELVLDRGRTTVS